MMPKSNISDFSKKCRAIKLPKGIREIHEDYGLWICKTLSKVSFEPRREVHPRYFEFYNISHLIEGKGWYWNEKTETIQELEAGQGIISIPGFVQFYSGDDCFYVEDSVAFTGSIAYNLFRSGIIKSGVINIGLGRRLLPIIELSSDPSNDSQIRANSALISLLTELYFENKSSGNISSGINTLLEKISEKPEKWWTVHEMAELCNLSANHFRRVFYSQTGLKPKEYVDKLKINKAIRLLCETNNSIAEISDQIGYSDQYHFSRRFKELTGFSPRKYRKDFFQNSANI
jgi:AraC-like DNA-binding protein